jgi:hypothetical protein
MQNAPSYGVSSSVMRPFLLMCLSLAACLHAPAEPSLHERVDALIEEKAAGRKISPQADDAEFLRRVWLDFDGGIPAADEAGKFLDDKSATKRADLIAKLIAAPRFAERMADAFHVMLMERRGDDKEWRAWLLGNFKSNKAWDAMVREMLAPDFRDEKQRGAGYFITKRLEKVGQQDTDYPGLARDVGRMFMGVDLQCAQCHNHRTVGSYKQVDFSGLFMAYQNVKLQPKDGAHASPWVSEGLITAKYEFTSVLTDKKGQTGPRIPFGDEAMVPDAKSDDAWLVKPDKKTKEAGQPKFSPLREIAQRLPAPENKWFARNIANRVWFLLMGRGLVHPLDLMHDDNAPSHPGLLDLLATEITGHGFDLRWLIQELAQTKTYQRASTLPEGATEAEPGLFLTAMERHLTAEQLLRAFLIASREHERIGRISKADPKDDASKYAMADFQKAFAAALANPAKEPELAVNPSLRSALFLRNSDPVQWALKPRAGSFIEHLAGMSDANAMAREMFLSILTRKASADEQAALSDWLAKHGDNRSQAVADYVWALLSSTEFFVNH